ncbi:MAG: hypothetical protein ABIH99_01505 [Candidatus Micrarchaeota archaeon]
MASAIPKHAHNCLQIPAHLQKSKLAHFLAVSRARFKHLLLAEDGEFNISENGREQAKIKDLARMLVCGKKLEQVSAFAGILNIIHDKPTPTIFCALKHIYSEIPHSDVRYAVLDALGRNIGALADNEEYELLALLAEKGVESKTRKSALDALLPCPASDSVYLKIRKTLIEHARNFPPDFQKNVLEYITNSLDIEALASICEKAGELDIAYESAKQLAELYMQNEDEFNSNFKLLSLILEKSRNFEASEKAKKRLMQCKQYELITNIMLRTKFKRTNDGEDGRHLALAQKCDIDALLEAIRERWSYSAFERILFLIKHVETEKHEEALRFIVDADPSLFGSNKRKAEAREAALNALVKVISEEKRCARFSEALAEITNGSAQASF